MPLFFNTHQYILYIQYRSIQINTNKYILWHSNRYNTNKCFPIQLSTLKYIYIQTNTDKYLPICAIHFITYQYLLIHTSTYHTYLYIPILSIQANIDGYISIQYIPICTLNTIFPYLPILTNTYEYLQIWPLNAYQYLPIHVIHTKNNTYPGQYMP